MILKNALFLFTFASICVISMGSVVSIQKRQISNYIGCTYPTELTVVAGDCTKFYVCASGYIQTFSCPTGLYFDTVLRICGYPNSINGVCSTSTTCTSALDFAPTSDCTKFYRCVNGVLITQQCGPGTVYNSLTKTCDYSYNVRGICGTTNYQSNCPAYVTWGYWQTYCSSAQFRIEYPYCCL